MIKRFTQQARILQLLRETGEKGLNSYDLTYTYYIKQAPTRINELREQGFKITSHLRPNRSVQYILHEKKMPVFKWEFDGNVARRVEINTEPVQQSFINSL